MTDQSGLYMSDSLTDCADGPRKGDEMQLGSHCAHPRNGRCVRPCFFQGTRLFVRLSICLSVSFLFVSLFLFVLTLIVGVGSSSSSKKFKSVYRPLSQNPITIDIAIAMISFVSLRIRAYTSVHRTRRRGEVALPWQPISSTLMLGCLCQWTV